MVRESDVAKSRTQLMLSSLGLAPPLGPAIYFKGFLLRFHDGLQIQVYIVLTANLYSGKEMFLFLLALEKSSCVWFSLMTNPEPIIVARGYNGLIVHP